ncbi:glycosyltransferase involved in cell wall biosynthesis [Entomoplasma freundtii]|uniref:Glycosyltransferase n=1 Tax=Entomoplasma freundtii TaxID=74700 RepID=A0A2K8NVH2_9MOLU|nr:glycosyltransferase family 2 protein [Entomoplasma freundtii]ATZ16633.1 glycosyltransferase [Entomoplasma freundtii]TDY58200.1 glycosyltransferase involved in cell wall biosynthesis [Entomoplasma freundtii]
MLVSFIISSQAKEEKLLKTLDSIKAQTNSNFEIILVDDEPIAGSNSLDFLHQEFFANPKITLVVNNRPQGPSTNWNTGLELARGAYTCFLKEGDIVAPHFVEKIAKLVKETNQPLDIIQFAQKHVGFIEQDTDNDEGLLISNKIYDLTTDHTPFAYLNQNLYGKLFATNIIKNYRIRFRDSNRFDALFVYRVLGHAKTFYKLPDVLITHLKTPLRYSVFDLVNQWPHILNYYRKIGTYKELRDELNYAYIYQLAYSFLSLTRQLENKQLYKKALRFSYDRMSGKLGNNFQKNKVYQKHQNEKFSAWIKEYGDQVSLELRRLK